MYFGYRLSIWNLSISMKTYLKRSYEKSLSNVYYSSSDTSNNFPSRVSIRTRIIQPSTKEQQRLLLATSPSTPRLQHVHSGKYGIKPIWPSDDLTCELWRQGKRSSKVIHGLSWNIHMPRSSLANASRHVHNLRKRMKRKTKNSIKHW